MAEKEKIGQFIRDAEMRNARQGRNECDGELEDDAQRQSTLKSYRCLLELLPAPSRSRSQNIKWTQASADVNDSREGHAVTETRWSIGETRAGIETDPGS